MNTTVRPSYKNERVAIALGVLSYVIALLVLFWPRLVWDASDTVYNLDQIFVALWFMCVIAVFIMRTKKFLNYWWVLLSAPICLWRDLVSTFVNLIWAGGGFAP